MSMCADQLLCLLPAMGAHEKLTGRWMLVNMHEFSLNATGDTFADMLTLDSPVSDGEQKNTEGAASASDVFHHLPSSKPGRKPLHQQFPEIVTIVTDFVQQRGFAAESRRRTSVGNAMGVTLAEKKAHVLSKIPQLAKKGFSRMITHELFIAPRRNTRNALRYHGLVSAKVLGKDNSLHSEHVNAHYAFAQVKYVRECCAGFEDEYLCLSCDDMNKVHVGSLAVSRYHQLRHFFPVDDWPVYSDHDYPYRNSKIIPSGYMVLQRKGQACTQQLNMGCSRSLSPACSKRASGHLRSRSFSPPRPNDV